MSQKVVNVSLAISTWNLTASAPGGESKQEIEALIKSKLDEGWTLPEGNVLIVKSNFGEQGQLTHLVNQFVFVKYEEVPAAKSKKDA